MSKNGRVRASSNLTPTSLRATALILKGRLELVDCSNVLKCETDGLHTTECFRVVKHTRVFMIVLGNLLGANKAKTRVVYDAMVAEGLLVDCVIGGGKRIKFLI